MILNENLAVYVFTRYMETSIEVLNIRIDEPVTTVTDLLLAAVSLFAFIKIRKLNIPGRAAWCFKYYFLILGMGALLGGIIGHAFIYRLHPGWKLSSWLLILISVALLAHALLELAKPFMKPGLTRLSALLNIALLTIAMVITIKTLEFYAVQYYAIFSLLFVVGSLSIYLYQKASSRASLCFISAICLASVSAIVFGLQWGIGPWLNHSDISHIILAVSNFVIYRGVVLIHDFNRYIFNTSI